MSRMDDEYQSIMTELERLSDPAWKAKLAHFGSRPANALGVPVAAIRALAKGRRSHELAARLWESGVHEARLLATMVENPKLVTREQADAWVRDFDAWDICDGACVNVFWKTPSAREKALEWAGAEEEYVRRAGFVMMAVLAVHEKNVGDEYFDPFFYLIEEYASDERNFVKKAVNWALRQIGKRRNSPGLYKKAVETAKFLAAMDSPAARWTGKDALKELLAREQGAD